MSPSAVVISDGGVDLPEGAAARLGVRVIPLMVRFGDQELLSGVDITPAEFYQRLRDQGEFPQTSQPSAGDYMKFYQEAAEAGLPIISMHLSGGLSGSIRSAVAAREQLPDLDIRIVDTGTLSGAMAMQVLVAAHGAERGLPPEEIIERVGEVGRRSEMFYTIDKLDYLRRGGRIGKVSGFVGSLLGIRPIITVEKPAGIYAPVGRARSWRGAVGQVVDMVVEKVGEGATASCMIMHGDCPEEAAWVTDQLRQRLDLQWLEVVRANPSLGAHVGPAAIGVAVFPGVLPALSLAVR